MIETALAMDPWVIATFMGAALLLYFTPGADMMFTIASGLSGGPKAGFAAAAGISCGIVVHVVVAALGLAALLLAYPAAYDAIRYVGAAYLLYLAVISWTAAAPSNRQGRSQLGRAFARGFITNMLNPKVALFILAFLPQFTDPAIGPVWQQIVILGLLLAAGGVVTDGLIGIFAGLFANRMSRATGVMRKLSSLVFAGLAARIALD